MHTLVTALPRPLTALVAVLLTGLLAVQGLPAALAASGDSELQGWTLSNPELPNGVIPLGQGRIAEATGRSYLLYGARYTHAPWVMVRDEATGESSHVALPAGTTGGTAWARADVAVVGNDLWVMAGAGPIYLRHYRLGGSPLPTEATLLSEQVLGDGDSRTGALTALASGAVAGVWHQQGATTPQRLYFVHTTAAGAMRTTSAGGMSTRSSTQALAQHPADGSVWAFSSADASGAIVAVRLLEGSAGLQVDLIDTGFITTQRYGSYGPEPSAPDVEVAADPATGTIAIAYQSAERKVFSTDPWVVGSHVAVARVEADASVSFFALPTYVERISAIGLVVRGSETWLVYRPVNEDLTFDVLQASRHDGSAWGEPVVLGTLSSARAMVYFGGSPVTIGGPMSDGRIWLFSSAAPAQQEEQPSADSDDTTGDDRTADDAPETTTTKGKGGRNGGGGKGGGPKK